MGIRTDKQTRKAASSESFEGFTDNDFNDLIGLIEDNAPPQKSGSKEVEARPAAAKTPKKSKSKKISICQKTKFSKIFLK